MRTRGVDRVGAATAGGRRRRTRRGAVMGVVAAVGLLVAGCSSDTATAPTTNPAGTSATSAPTTAPTTDAPSTTAAPATDAPTTTAAPALGIPFTEATVLQATDDAGATSWTISWSAPDIDGVEIYAGTDPLEVGRDHKVGEGAAAGELTVTDLPDAARWYFELVPSAGEPLIVADRSLHFADAPNFRDTGGYRTEDGRWVRMGLLYRSDTLAKLNDDEVQALQDLEVKLVCDLRTAGEIESSPDVSIPGAEWLHLDVFASTGDITALITNAITSGDVEQQQELLGDGKSEQLLVDAARAFIDNAEVRGVYQSMYERISDTDNLATVFHCTGGKDRTGWAAASFLLLMGVPRDVVMTDYLLSNEYLAAQNQGTLDAVKGLIDPALLEPVLVQRAEYMQTSFDTLDAEYGTIEKYFTDGLGLDASTIDTLRDIFLVG